jgi:chromosome segregation ATPase
MDIKTLKEEIGKGLRSFKAFENAHAVLTELETLEDVKKDMEGRVNSTNSKLQALADEAKKVEGIIADGKEKAEALVKAAQDSVEDIILKANVKAGEIIKAAEKKASDIGAEVDVMVSKSLQLQNELSDLNDAKAKVQAEIDALEKVKDQARKALGV